MAVAIPDLYSYQKKNGIILPETSAVKETVENMFRQIFGNDLDVSAETPMGRIIEAITLMFVDVLGVNAQNANGFNPIFAAGAYLDALGNMFGVTRNGESDAKYRARLMASQSRGSGYAQSMRQAIAAVSGVTSVCVLENGHNYPSVLPNSNHGVLIPAHSCFVCVAGGSNNNIADAIIATKSAGCGFTTTTEYGTPITVTRRDATTGSDTVVKFYRPTQKPLSISVTVRQGSFTGDDIEAAVKEAVLSLIADKPSSATITETEVASVISGNGSGIVVTNVTLSSGGTELEEVTILPYQYLNVSDSDITVTIQ